MPKLKAFIAKYEHYLSVGSFLVGFAIDSVALKRIDLLISNAFIITYLAVAILSMAVLHYRAAHPAKKEWRQRIVLWLPFVAQFAFGGMFSGFLIFYSQSGSVIASWPFLFLIVCLIITNEFLRKYQSRLTFQTLLLFFCLFSFSIYTLPIILGRMGSDVFELSGGAALVMIAAYLGFLSVFGWKRVRESLEHICIGIAAIYFLITTLYFSNVLPPIPLALKDIGISHKVVHIGSDYIATEEPAPWYSRLTGVTVTLGAHESAYGYSSVFAPTRLQASIVHEWQHYDESTKKWVTKAKIPFAISGGRDGGYRGYTIETNVAPGKWRLNVETDRGQLIGREDFTVVRGSATTTVERILQ